MNTANSLPEIRLWDGFICHASEDKENFVRPLADFLRKEGVKVWFDEFEIGLGDSIIQKIEKGLANSTAGALVLSRASIEKSWPRYEANAIKQLHIANNVRLIPILKDISFNDLKKISPSLIDLKGIDAQRQSVPECAYQVIEAVRPDLLSNIHLQYADRLLQSSGETAVLSLESLKKSPRRREKLPERDILRICVLHACFVELFGDSVADWVDSFCRDLNYESELRVWERMATSYLRCVNNENLSKDEKSRIFGVLLGLFSGATTDQVQKGFESLPSHIGDKLYSVVEAWLYEWRDSLKLIVDRELSDEQEVERLIERHKKTAPLSKHKMG